MSIIKDPIYGYIEISKDILHNIIDTAIFQRLRNIRQTSYAPLYPSALHNRFVHSIGVYHLGKIAFESVWKSMLDHEKRGTPILSDLVKLFGKSIERYKSLFELACLLHDVGHSPFSHTGEEFYKKSTSKIAISNKKPYTYNEHLRQLTNDDVFISAAAENPAPHEIMSCIVALEAFGGKNEYFQNDDEKSFFARCITGIIYADVTGLTDEKYRRMTVEQHDGVKKKLLLNCFIQLLHSSVIDVDRLDYIIRDSITTGYQNVSVDYKRLLTGIVLVMDGQFNFTTGYHKNAISIIENVVYAHDNEKKWVQGHPTILYESYLLRKAIITIDERIKESKTETQSTFFSYDSLTEEGSQFNNCRIRYLSDADLIYLMKNVYQNEYSEEYFHRSMRRRPIWKSESEFKQLFDDSERNLLEKAMGTIMAGSLSDADGVEVNIHAVEAIDEEIRKAKEGSYENEAKALEKKKQYFISLLNVCDQYNIKQDVLLLSTKFFKSNFSKGDINNLIIAFENGYAKFEYVSTPLSGRTPNQKTLVYLFYYPGTEGVKVDIKSFSEALVTEFKKI